MLTDLPGTSVGEVDQQDYTDGPKDKDGPAHIGQGPCKVLFPFPIHHSPEECAVLGQSQPGTPKGFYICHDVI